MFVCIVILYIKIANLMLNQFQLRDALIQCMFMYRWAGKWIYTEHQLRYTFTGNVINIKRKRYL